MQISVQTHSQIHHVHQGNDNTPVSRENEVRKREGANSVIIPWLQESSAAYLTKINSSMPVTSHHAVTEQPLQVTEQAQTPGIFHEVKFLFYT